MPSAVPSSIPTERWFLGNILVDPDVAWECGAGSVSPADFFFPAHGLLFDAMCWLRAQNHAITAPTVPWALGKLKTLARCDELLGPPWTEPYIAGLYERIYTAHNTAAMVRIIKEYAERRREIQRGLGIVNRAVNGQDQRPDRGGVEL